MLNYTQAYSKAKERSLLISTFLYFYYMHTFSLVTVYIRHITRVSVRYGEIFHERDSSLNPGPFLKLATYQHIPTELLKLSSAVQSWQIAETISVRLPVHIYCMWCKHVLYDITQ